MIRWPRDVDPRQPPPDRAAVERSDPRQSAEEGQGGQRAKERSKQYGKLPPNHRQLDPRTGHRRELGRTRHKGPDMTERTHACLQDVGLYRCASHRDLVKVHFSDNRFAAAKGLQRLVRSGAMQKNRVRGPKGGAFTVYTLTKAGAALAQRLAVKRGLDPEQRAWAGMVKPREAAHDADVAKACRKEIEALTARGAQLRRILIDAELKGILAKRSETARAKKGREEADRARRKAATELHLPCDDEGHVQIPDAQIQYVDEAGNLGRVNVEVASGHYREASVKAKSAAGFSMHGAGKGGQAPNTRTSLSSLGGGGGRRGGGRSSGDPASVEI